jgi:hypothetical protein
LNKIEKNIIKTIGSVNLERYEDVGLNIKDNVKKEEQSKKIVKYSSIENTMCLPVFLDGVCDIITDSKDDIVTLENVNFDVDNYNPNYIIGQPITINKIEISYDYIGLVTTIARNTEITINKKTFNLTPTSLYNVNFIKAAPIYLFDELNGVINLELSPYENGVDTKMIKLRTIERNREFQVSNLKIAASGLIGENSFTATADISGLVTPTTNIIPLNRLGISSMTFIGEICCSKIVLNEKFDINLILDNIIPTSNYLPALILNNPGRFMADVDIYIVANKNYRLAIEA